MSEGPPKEVRNILYADIVCRIMPIKNPDGTQGVKYTIFYDNNSTTAITLSGFHRQLETAINHRINKVLSS